MTIPSIDDWNPNKLGEDALSAFEKFSGKSNEEVQRYFYTNVISAINEISFMPAAPFQYYLLGLCQYLTGENLNKYEASAAASGFLNLILQKAESSFDLIEPLTQHLIPTVEHVAENQFKYGADKDIYGNFEVTSRTIKEIIKRRGKEAP